MNVHFEDAAKKSGLPVRIIAKLYDDGMINLPPGKRDKVVLATCSRMWCDSFYIGQMLSQYKIETRMLIAAFPTFGEIERFLFRRLLTPARVNVEKLLGRVRVLYGVDYDIDDLQKLRRLAWNLKRKENSQDLERTLLILSLEKRKVSDES